jgi:VWFA-related protein
VFTRWLGAVLAGFVFSSHPIRIDNRAQFSIQSVEPQTPHLIPRTREERERHSQNLHRLLLSVQVSARSLTPAAELKQSDFVILKDQSPQAITSFQSILDHSEDESTRVVLVLDTVNNSSGKVAHFRKEIEKYLKEGSGPLANPTSIALLSERGVQLGAHYQDRNLVLRELDELAGNLHTLTCADTVPALTCSVSRSPDGSSPPCDLNPRLECLDHLFNSSGTAINSMADELVNNSQKVTNAGRVILIWVGSGWPLLNERGYTPDTREAKESLYRDLVTVSSALAEAHVTLDAVASSEPLPISLAHIRESFFFKGVPDENHVTAASLALQALAYQSGGVVLTSTKDIADQISRCVSDSQSYYLLSFDNPPATRDGEYHALVVKVDKPGLTVRTRTVFYAER